MHTLDRFVVASAPAPFPVMMVENPWKYIQFVFK